MLSAPSMFNESSATSSTPLDPNYIQPTLNHGLRIWWAYYWPTVVAEIVLSMLATSFFRLLYNEVIISAETMLWGLRIQAYLLEYFLSLFTLYYVLHRRFRNFRIALLPRAGDPSSAPMPVTAKRSLRVWWTFSWRTLIYRLIVTFVATIPLGMIGGVLSEMSRVMAALVPLLEVLLISAVVGLFVMYSNVLDEEFGDFRVALVPRENKLETSPAPAVAASTQTGA